MYVFIGILRYRQVVNHFLPFWNCFRMKGLKLADRLYCMFKSIGWFVEVR